MHFTVRIIYVSEGGEGLGSRFSPHFGGTRDTSRDWARHGGPDPLQPCVCRAEGVYQMDWVN